MTREKMTVERVLQLIEAFGAEPGGWPEDERAAASSLIEAEPDVFAEALSEARALDAFLLSEALPEPSDELVATILAPAGAALATLMMGKVGGYAYASGNLGYDQADAVYYAAFSVDSDASWLSLE